MDACSSGKMTDIRSNRCLAVGLRETHTLPCRKLKTLLCKEMVWRGRERCNGECTGCEWCIVWDAIYHPAHDRSGRSFTFACGFSVS